MGAGASAASPGCLRNSAQLLFFKLPQRITDFILNGLQIKPSNEGLIFDIWHFWHQISRCAMENIRLTCFEKKIVLNDFENKLNYHKFYITKKVHKSSSFEEKICVYRLQFVIFRLIVQIFICSIFSDAYLIIQFTYNSPLTPNI